MFELVLGTGNAHKVMELRQMLPQDSFRLLSLADIPHAIDVDETGATFAENARLKAAEQAKHLACWVLAEDSGLSVDALGGRPGVLSARFAGTHGDDEANNRLLLRELANVPRERRSAAFHCHMAVADPCGRIVLETMGLCRGMIAFEPSGAGGFGYDPLFTIPEYHLTFAQLGSGVKNVLSHRSRALQHLIPPLSRLAASGIERRAR
ncbi:MAG: RdgB/HAM1 family non-canonical purine NTP pyrophosphatase [Planctomycetaceae bacterium]